MDVLCAVYYQPNRYLIVRPIGNLMKTQKVLMERLVTLRYEGGATLGRNKVKVYYVLCTINQINIW